MQKPEGWFGDVKQFLVTTVKGDPLKRLMI